MAENRSEQRKDRVTVRLNGHLGHVVDEIINLTPAHSQSEVIRRALASYHALVLERAAGHDLQIIEELDDGTRKRKPIFL